MHFFAVVTVPSSPSVSVAPLWVHVAPPLPAENAYSPEAVPSNRFVAVAFVTEGGVTATGVVTKSTPLGAEVSLCSVTMTSVVFVRVTTAPAGINPSVLPAPPSTPMSRYINAAPLSTAPSAYSPAFSGISK